ncbi:GTPase domain-containing protein [Mycolicibacterium austroafricanum]|uniref:GTPase domain-containing protein n=1 Tax=Mycolicibacterium austroafricanum TaxID=39687 RepID=UPI00130E5F50|nr:GTPase domain-containing protein [Mycolicibacterium austroafricanum]QZY43644.1 50S ribosome-binding GTPase [Mycolicibacterium austroafricanum]
MGEPIDIEAAKAWLHAVPGGAVGEGLDQRWRDFAAIGDPVVTIYGSYDTGKSSLLRRLLIEFGQEVPAWLTISARHETFEVNQIHAAGCLLRDTPGFVSGGTDARAEMNTGLASDAIALTDVAIVVVPPQLATAEYPELRELVQQDWAPGSLWFVISRFDEAGIDPDDDPHGYRALSEHKEGELRAALTLDESVPVYVVCQDFAQMVGTERNPDPSVWDESRSWDGISELVAAITALGSHTKSDIRQAAAQRFWGDSVHQVLHQLRKELGAHLENAAVSDEGEHRRASWLAQLDTLARAAEADLRGRVSAAVADAVDSPDPAQSFAQALKTSIGAWHAAAKRDIDKLLRSIGDTVTTERARPDWQRFEDLAGKLRPESPTSEYTADDDLVFAPVVRQVGDAVLNALRHYEQSRGLKLSSAGTGAAGTASGVDRIAAAAAGVSVIAELAVIAEQFANRQHAAKAAIQQRAELQSELVKAGDEATALALKTLNELADEARQRINDATADQVDLRDGLRRLVGELRSHIASGEALLSN